MKLLYITNGINGAGGLERVLSVKASILADQFGYEVSIIVLNSTGESPFYRFSSAIKIIPIEVSGNSLTFLLRYLKKINRIVNDIQPDIISVCDDGLKGFFIPTMIKSRAKIIYERHASIRLNTDDSIKGKILRWVMMKCSGKFDRFIVLTHENEKEWNSENLEVIPNPLSFYPDECSSLNHHRVIVVGSHSYNKGYDTLLKIWSLLTKEFPSWHLNIFGKFDKNQTFVEMATKIGLTNCTFHPPTPLIEKEYLKSDLLFLPSRSEGFGMVLIEAMACGVPCIAFNCPSGPGDIIDDENDGYLIEDQNTEQFIAKAMILMSDLEKRKNMGAVAKQNVIRYKEEEIVKVWDNLFRTL